jgi:SPP1 gp7 family putative phage head morphogenesis protein
MSVNNELLDAQVSHNIDLQIYGNGVVNRIIAILNRTDADLFAQLTTRLEQLPQSAFSVERLESLLASTRALNARVYAEISTELNSELKSLVEYEAGFQLQLFNNTIPVQINYATVNIEQAYTAALARPFQGRLLREWMQGLEADKAAKIRDAIRIGYVENETTNRIIQRIRGTRALNFKDGLLEANRNNVEAVVRTALNHYSNFTRDLFFERNSDVIKGLRWTSTLDARTSSICQARDGQIYKLDSGPRPPAHMNCRSVMVAVTKSWRELGIDADELPASTRASMDGQVPDSLTYQTWLQKQSVDRQNEILGVTKAKLFRDGGLTLDRFVSNKGHVYTLEQLKQRDALAFKKAGLN